MQSLIIYLIVVVVFTVEAKDCDDHGYCPSKWYCKDGKCAKMIKPPGACDRSVECIGGSHCESVGWSEWLNQDKPSGKGDYELTEDFREEGMLTCDNPTAIECRTVETHIPAAETGQVFDTSTNCTVEGGLGCTNNQQEAGSRCQNYEVRYYCSDKRCTERCRADADCLMYKGGRKKYCTSGGLVTLVKGYCEPQKVDGEACSRHQECQKKRFCKNAICKEAEEAVTCHISCVGPNPKNPQRIKVGDNVYVTYSCIFVRQGPQGPMYIEAELILHRKFIVESGNGTSPLTLSGHHTELIKLPGIYTYEIRGVMKNCINHRKYCSWGKRCVIYV